MALLAPLYASPPLHVVLLDLLAVVSSTCNLTPVLICYYIIVVFTLTDCLCYTVYSINSAYILLIAAHVLLIAHVLRSSTANNSLYIYTDLSI